eukprot:14538240-Alexandrium_andersonii.AAC.1
MVEPATTAEGWHWCHRTRVLGCMRSRGQSTASTRGKTTGCVCVVLCAWREEQRRRSACMEGGCGR